MANHLALFNSIKHWKKVSSKLHSRNSTYMISVQVQHKTMTKQTVALSHLTVYQFNINTSTGSFCSIKNCAENNITVVKLI